MSSDVQLSTSSGSLPRPQVVFGSDADTPYGYDGDDYLEGNAGLTSGKGRDTLDGGAGFDAYWISAGEQSATICDAGGSADILGDYLIQHATYRRA